VPDVRTWLALRDVLENSYGMLPLLGTKVSDRPASPNDYPSPVVGLQIERVRREWRFDDYRDRTGLLSNFKVQGFLSFYNFSLALILPNILL